ncbi:uncharacterized protein Z519_02623 [Cladophialophora bantiana CBS 173.52]|uniref:Uncharacterized protein n=1 Tax=Cladophialophora bantiana (strain ATCC 10958 / CBS 173.52 / CDC B-1940 / NIH 8579) TaxID=1442370 RepID=A0A0D2F4R6_CLAB1|nr:uncharacterized protein Z519_02623 [Cladophialophora bantiana CBS 173.52]KIW97231.1 hypothetical protein Z519_02623 [Cladophialophora bantiana CBS 173.52]
MDTRARYGAALGNKIGMWSELVFNFITAAGCLLLGVIDSIESVLGATEVLVPIFVVVLFVVFMLVWTYASLAFATSHDEARSVNNIGQFLRWLAFGAFGGLATATPAFILLQNARTHLGPTLEPI